MIAGFARNVLRSRFIVDEKPVPVYLPPGESDDDLAELASRVLIDHDRLIDLTGKLEAQSRQGNPEALEKLMRSMLPTLDSFDRLLNLARSHPPGDEVDNWLKSIETIYFRLLSLLESHELVQLKALGRTVDLNQHEVVEYRRSDQHPNDTVIGERQKGYAFRGKLMRDAKVVVAYNESRRQV